MTQPSPTTAGIHSRLARLETDEAAAGPTAPCRIVIYLPTDTEEEIRRRIPAGAGLTLLLPHNGRDPDRDPGPPPPAPV